MISVFKSYLAPYFVFLCKHCREIRSHWGEVHEAMFVVVSFPTNGSSVACNVVIWLSFLSIKLSSQRSAFSGKFLKVKHVKKVEKGFLSFRPWYSRALLIGRSGEWSWSTTWLPIVCNNLLSPVTGIRRRKPSNLLPYRKSCEVWVNNPSNMKRFNRHSIYDSDL